MECVEILHEAVRVVLRQGSDERDEMIVVPGGESFEGDANLRVIRGNGTFETGVFPERK